VITLELDAADMAATRFTVSPLHETVVSLFPMYMCPDMSQTRWVREVRSRADLDHDLLGSLVSPSGQIPDFVSPPPTRPRPRFGEQLDQVRETPPEIVFSDVHAAYSGMPLPRALKRCEDDPASLRDAVVSELARYWAVAIVPHWLRMQAILEADVLYRGLQCAQIGAGATYNQIDPHIHWNGSALVVDILESWDRHVPVAGRVTQLIPSVFTPTPTLPVGTDVVPVLGYPARRSALLWHELGPSASGAIRGLLGRRRAGLLLALDQPRSTTDLASQMTVTPSAISQHLQVLAAAGLVERARFGRVVLYSRSELGQLLVDRTGSIGAYGDGGPLTQLGDLSA
jgi:DNA-binding transcriptional ArsR family regulator